VLLLRVTSMSKGINFTPFLPAESTLQPEGPGGKLFHSLLVLGQNHICIHCTTLGKG